MSHPKPSEKRKGLGAGIIAFGVVFALFSLLFRPHTVGAFALATALSLFAGAVIRVMAQGLDVSPTVKTPESLQKVQGNTGDPDVDALLEKGRGMIAEIRAENDRIPDSSPISWRSWKTCAPRYSARYTTNPPRPRRSANSWTITCPPP